MAYADLDLPGDASKPTAQADHWWDRPQGLRYRVVAWLAARFPSRIDPPFVIAERHYFSTHDHGIGDQGLAEEGMAIATDGLWAVEFYTPATIEALIDRVMDLGWDEESSETRDVLTWLRRARDGQEGSRRLRLKRPTAEGGRFSFFEMPLPAFAEQVFGEFQTVSRSILRLTLFFAPRAAEQLRINTVLREVLTTQVEATMFGATVFTPERVREKLIAEIRSDWREQILDWCAAYFPGVFTTGGDRSAMPSCELAVAEGFEPYPPGGPEGPPKVPMLRALEMNYSPWLFEESGRRDIGYPSALFAANCCRAEGLRHHSILVVPRERYEGTEAVLHRAGGPERFALDVDSRFKRTIGLWAALALLQHYSQLLAAAQDQMHGMFGRANSLGVLRRVRAFTARCADARTVSREMIEMAESGDLSCSEGYDFVRERVRAREEATPVLTVIKHSIERDGRNLGIAVGELNEFLHQQANLLTAAANLRLQWAVGALAVCGLVATILGLDPVKRWLGWDHVASVSTISAEVPPLLSRQAPPPTPRPPQ